MSKQDSSRRAFLKRSALLGGGLIVGVHLPGCSFDGELPITVARDGFIPNAFLQITADNNIVFYCPSDEMGQGVHTGLATLIGEELDVHPEDLSVVSAGAHEDYKNPEYGIQLTGGSNATRIFWLPLRQVGADTRNLILSAAAMDLGIPKSQLGTRRGHVVAGTKQYPYGDFIATAATLDLPEDTPLKQAIDFNFIGQEFTRVDAAAKSRGTAQFGIDADIPGMVYAVVARAPVAGARALSVDKTVAESLPGVIRIVEISSGIAVIADSYWRANKAARALTVTWGETSLARVDSATVQRDLQQALDNHHDITAESEGDIEAGFNAASHTYAAEYYAPFLAHAPLEPVNATLHLQSDRADLWTGVQSVQAAQGLVERITGLPRGNIRVHNLYLGGGFGRRGTLTHIVEVAEIAREIDRPVQLLWSREDDIQHGLYRPASLMRIKAGMGKDGRISAWEARRAGGNITDETLANMLPALFPSMPTGILSTLTRGIEYLFSQWHVDPSSVEGLYETYSLPHIQVSHATVDHGLPLTFWRSVGHSYTAFAVESMMDELAEQMAVDPVTFRLEHTRDKPRMHTVLRTTQNLMATMSVPEGHFLGVACHTSFLTDVAQIAEVSVEDETIRVHRVTCIADVGVAVNPDIIRAQLEGAVMFALTATLYGEINLEAGRVVQSNFHDYPILRMDQAPAVDVVILESGTEPTGIGEPGVPPLAPAIANGVYRATGQRLRRLPLRLT